jgi:hypothetical protein
MKIYYYSYSDRWDDHSNDAIFWEWVEHFESHGTKEISCHCHTELHFLRDVRDGHYFVG